MTAKTSVTGHPCPKVNKIKMDKGGSGRLNFFFAFYTKFIITLVLCTLVPGTLFLVSTNLQGDSSVEQ